MLKILVYLIILFFIYELIKFTITYLVFRYNGFKWSEVVMIFKVLKRNYIHFSFLLFRDPAHLKAIIAIFSTEWNEKGGDSLKKVLEKLYHMRGKLDHRKVKSTASEIKSTKNLLEGQKFTIVINNTTSIDAILIENTQTSFVLELKEEPVNVPKQVTLFLWHNKVSYGFQSTIAKREENILKFPHTEAIFKRFKRKYKRVKAENINAEFFIINKNIFASSEHTDCLYERSNLHSFPCQLKDISEGGLSLIVDGRGEANLLLKIQLILQEKSVILFGDVKAVTFNSELNQSVMHIQYKESIPFEMKEPILAFVYGIN